MARLPKSYGEQAGGLALCWGSWYSRFDRYRRGGACPRPDPLHRASWDLQSGKRRPMRLTDLQQSFILWYE
jgi:hypothetical protein